MEAIGLLCGSTAVSPRLFYTEEDSLIPVPDQYQHLFPEAYRSHQDRTASMNDARLTALSDDFKALQDAICVGLEAEESALGGAVFRGTLGNGLAVAVVEHGCLLLAKFGNEEVNFSEVEGEACCIDPNEHFRSLLGCGSRFGPSSQQSHVPIVHMNVRHFALSDGTSWFGGGIDLTPHYVEPEEAAFHRA